MIPLEITDLTKVFPTPDGPRTAVDHISLEVAAGTATSIIGRNGAGKSTILKMAAGIMSPTSGRVRRHARCASLIELGMAFHPDLTGAENLELGLALAGLNRREAARTWDDVVEFAALTDALDRQLKFFSNGMTARLACSIAVHSRPRLLLVDEILAVGDLAFQRQMIDRIAALVDDGAALLLVTHSLDLAAETTTSTLWIEGGVEVDRGPTSQVLADYEAATGDQVRYAQDPPLRFTWLDIEPKAIEPGGALQVAATVDVERPAGAMSFRVELRPVQGTTETWMRDPEEPADRRHLNLLAATDVLTVDQVQPGRHRLQVDISTIPVTSTRLEVSVVAVDALGAVADSLSTELAVGELLLRPEYRMLVERTSRAAPPGG